MSSTKFIATYSESVQISPDDFRLLRTSKVFFDTSSLGDILDWLKSLGVREPSITSVDFSDLDE